MGLGLEKEDLWARRSSFNDASSVLNGVLQSRFHAIVRRAGPELLPHADGVGEHIQSVGEHFRR